LDKETRKLIYRKYPMTEKERQGCRQEIERMKFIRMEYAKRLNEQKGNSQTECSFTTEV